MEKEQKLLGEIAQMGDLQEAWTLLLRCAVPRANHTLRTGSDSEFDECLTQILVKWRCLAALEAGFFESGLRFSDGSSDRTIAIE